MQSSPLLHTAMEEAAATGVIGAGTTKREQQIHGSASRGGRGGGVTETGKMSHGKAGGPEGTGGC